MIDGAYMQTETFWLRIGHSLKLEFTREQIEELHRVTGAMLEQADEAVAWPFGEFKRRRLDDRRYLPVRRADV